MSHHRFATPSAALAVAAAAALVLALPTTASTTTPASPSAPRPAAAGDRVPRVVLHDPSGDVWMSDETSGDVLGVDAPDADVLTAHVVHARHQLRIHMAFDDLQRVTAQHYAVNIITSARDPSLQLTADTDSWDGEMLWAVGRHEGAWCADATHAIDYGADTVDVSVPRTCLGRPDTIQVYLWNYLQFEDRSIGYYADNPHNTSFSSFQLTPRLRRQPVAGDPTTRYQVTLTDASGDVKTEVPWYRTAPETPGVDITRAVAAYRAHSILARVHFTDLQRTKGWQDVGVYLILSGWKTRDTSVGINASHPHGQTVGMDSCDGLGHRVSYADDTVQITIPRTCLPKDTDWARVGMSTAWLPDGIEAAIPGYIDNPHTTDSSGGLTHRLYRTTT